MAYKYLCLYPDGSTAWITCDKPDSSLSEAFRQAIGCSCLEQVRSLIPDILFLVDESGKIKDPPQQLNPYASRIYFGSVYGDPVVGPVIFVRIGLVESDGFPELGWLPLFRFQLSVLSLYLGIPLPDLEDDENV